jgi:hypothetical protein
MMARTGGARRTSRPTTAGGTAVTPSRPGRPCSVSGGAESDAVPGRHGSWPAWPVVRRPARPYTACVNLLLRTVWLVLTARFRSRCHVLGPVRTPFRVLPTDLDVLRHMNNGVYKSLLDLARTDLMGHAGLSRRTMATKGRIP